MIRIMSKPVTENLRLYDIGDIVIITNDETIFHMFEEDLELMRVKVSRFRHTSKTKLKEILIQNSEELLDED